MTIKELEALEKIFPDQAEEANAIIDAAQKFIDHDELFNTELNKLLLEVRLAKDENGGFYIDHYFIVVPVSLAYFDGWQKGREYERKQTEEFLRKFAECN